MNKCETCRFWSPVHGNLGECRKDPPEWPSAGADQWCGQWQPLQLNDKGGGRIAKRDPGVYEVMAQLNRAETFRHSCPHCGKIQPGAGGHCVMCGKNF